MGAVKISGEGGGVNGGKILQILYTATSILLLYQPYIIYFRVLLKFGADPEATDDLGRRPVECIPDIDNFDLVVDAQVSVTPLINNLESRSLEYII